MPRHDDSRYFEGRAAQEFELAKNASTASVREDHLKFAESYLGLARQIRQEVRCSPTAVRTNWSVDNGRSLRGSG